MSTLFAFLTLAYPLLDIQGVLSTPEVGDHVLHVVTPRLVELHLVTTQEPPSDDGEETFPTTWDFLTNDSRKANAPTGESFTVVADGIELGVVDVGFKRQVVYAPVGTYDLRIGNSIYVLLQDAIPSGATVTVTDSSADAHDYLTGLSFSAKAEPDRLSQTIHVNQVGYVTNTLAKRGYASLYLGDLGVVLIDDATGEWVVKLTDDAQAGTFKDMQVPLGVSLDDGYELVRVDTGEAVYPSAGEAANWKVREDSQWQAYGGVLEADFSRVTSPGWYRLMVPGMGGSLPFRIDDGVASTFARSFAMGLYHQRSAQDHALPYTRFIDGPAHLAPASMPFDDTQDEATYRLMAEASNEVFADGGTEHPAPQVRSPETLLFPYVGDVVAWWPMDGKEVIVPEDLIEGFDSYDDVTITDPYLGDSAGHAFGGTPSRAAADSQESWEVENVRFEKVKGFDGFGFVNTYHLPEGSASASGVQATGHLRTKTFTISQPWVALLVGGSAQPYDLAGAPNQGGATAANLVIGDQRVATATGANSNTLAWNYWDVSAFQGQAAYVEIVDSSESGFIMADALMQTSRDHVRDLSAKRRHASRKNGLSFSSEPGPLAGALAFDGVDDHVLADALPDLDGATELTVSFWIRLKDLTRDQIILAKGTNDIEIRYQASNQSLKVDVGNVAVEGTWRALSDEEWHFVAVRFEANISTGLRLFLDHDPAGPSSSTEGLASFPITTAPLYLGNNAALSTDAFLHGELDDLRLRNGLVSAEELVESSAGVGPWIDVSGGHFDAGDYSKYMKNSGLMAHILTFTVDQVHQISGDGGGPDPLDNLGIPESGDGICDLLQEAKWEADYIAKMQDSDGGFFCVVNPRERRFEHDVLPSQGDRQVVWPKTLITSGVAVGALAQLGHSPAFKKHYPTEAAEYRAKALLGWEFIEAAVEKHGVEGGFQRIFHYGGQFGARDELAYAAAAMFAMTGDPAYEARLLEWMPYDTAILLHEVVSGWRPFRRFTWQRLYESAGAAMRTYAFAKRGALSGSEITYDPTLFLGKSYIDHVMEEIIGAAEDQLSRADSSPFGVSVPTQAKHFDGVTYLFPESEAFDLITAQLLEPKEAYEEAIQTNLSYHAGANPVNVSFISGLGWGQPRNFVSQWAENDERVLPPIGFTCGSVNSGVPFLQRYGPLLGRLAYPPNVSSRDFGLPYGTYDRWADTFHIGNEFVILDHVRSMATASYLMAQVPGSAEATWVAPPQVTILGLPDSLLVGETHEVRVQSSADLSQARVLWESRGNEPTWGETHLLRPRSLGESWVELEVLWPDGRRSFARETFPVKLEVEMAYAENFQPIVERFGPAPYRQFLGNENVRAFYPLDGSAREARGEFVEGGPVLPDILLTGGTTFDDQFFEFTGYVFSRPEANVVRLQGADDTLELRLPSPNVVFPASSAWISAEAMVYVDAFEEGVANSNLLTIETNGEPRLSATRGRWQGPTVFQDGYDGEVDVEASVPTKRWLHLRMLQDATHARLFIDGQQVQSIPSDNLAAWLDPNAEFVLRSGQFYGWVSDIILKAGSGAVEVRNPNPTVAAGAPYVDLEGEYDLDIAETMTLDASVRDDASVDLLETVWKGPAEVIFSDPAELQTNVSFTAPGDFWIRLEATDTDGNVSSGGIFARVRNRSGNTGPGINLMVPEAVVLPAAWKPEPIISDDGYPENTLSFQWAQISGPSAASISDVAVANPLVMFPAGGIYTFQLDVSDGHLTTVDQIAVAVESTIPGNLPGVPFEVDTDTLLLYHFDHSLQDASGNGYTLSAEGGVSFQPETAWMENPVGASASFAALGDQLTVTLPDALIFPNEDSALTVEWRYLSNRDLAFGNGSYPIVSLEQSFNSRLIFFQDRWTQPTNGSVYAGETSLVSAVMLEPFLPKNTWAEMKITYVQGGAAQLYVNGGLVAEVEAALQWERESAWMLTLGNVDGYVDELRVSSVARPEIARNRRPQVALDPLVNVSETAAMVTMSAPVVLDDGLPADATLEYFWEVVSGPNGQAHLDSPRSPTPTITFNTAGDYRFRLTVSDGDLSTTAETELRVAAVNEPPTVALTDSEVTMEVDESYQPSVDVTDDGLPAESSLTYLWEVVEGEASEVLFVESETSKEPVIRFRTAGEFRLRLTISDTALSASESIRFTVLKKNEPPTVALSDSALKVEVDESYQPTVTVMDDGLPAESSLTYLWEVAEGGAGDVLFTASETLKEPVIRFQAPGEYTLRLTISDTALSASESIRFIVLKKNEPPTLALEASVILEWPERSFVPAVQVSDDGLPEESVLTYLWTAVGAGIDRVSFTNPSEARPDITLSSRGTYQIHLTASDGVLESSAELTVTALADPYTSWIESHFTADERASSGLEGSLWGDQADPDRDGLVNLAEAYAGTDPRVSETSPVIETSWEGGTFVVRWRRAKDTKGISAEWLSSLDLLDFDPIDQTMEVSIVEDHAAWELLEGRFSSDLHQELFLSIQLASERLALEVEPEQR